MRIKKHGLSIGMERLDDEFYLTLKAVGKLTHADYQVITPLIDAALEGVKQPRVKALIDALEMDGWELRAAWDDFKMGLKHGSEFVKIAIVGHKRWQELIAKIGAWFISGEVQYFESVEDAVAWLEV